DWRSCPHQTQAEILRECGHRFNRCVSFVVVRRCRASARPRSAPERETHAWCCHGVRPFVHLHCVSSEVLSFATSSRKRSIYCKRPRISRIGIALACATLLCER
ncbi:unnamed protein product, partial [Ectocarpus sp. 8 AP-2014]